MDLLRLVLLYKPPAPCVLTDFVKEAAAGVIDLSDDEPEILDMMLTYLYTGDYSEYSSMTALSKASPPTATSPNDAWGALPPDQAAKAVADAMLFHTKVYIIADKYDVQDLKPVVVYQFLQHLRGQWNTTGFIASLDLLYENTSENDTILKNAAMEAIGVDVWKLMEREDFKDLGKKYARLTFDTLASLATVQRGALTNPAWGWASRITSNPCGHRGMKMIVNMDNRPIPGDGGYSVPAGVTIACNMCYPGMAPPSGWGGGFGGPMW